jgi:hypothetical protein
VLCHLACLPSRGVEIALLAHLVNKTENTVRTLLDECATLGSIVIRNTKVQFVHDKPHTAALGLIDPQEKPRLFAKIARNLEGLSTDYNFVRADMLLSAYHSDPELLETHEVVKAGESHSDCLCPACLFTNAFFCSGQGCSASSSERGLGSGVLICQAGYCSVAI